MDIIDGMYATVPTLISFGMVYPTPSTLHPQPYTLNPTPSTLHPQPYTLNPTPSTLHPQPYTLNPTPSTLNRKPAWSHPSPVPTLISFGMVASETRSPQAPTHLAMTPEP